MRRLTDVASNDNDDLLEGLTRRSIVVARRRSDGGSFDALERSLLQTSNEVVRRALESVLQEFASDDAGVVEVSGSRYRRHQKAAMEYHSLCGKVRVERWTYRLIGVRNGPTVVPLELQAGLIERATPALAFAVAHGAAKAPSRSVHQDLEVAHRAPPSRATMDRMAKSIGTALEADFDDDRARRARSGRAP